MSTRGALWAVVASPFVLGSLAVLTLVAASYTEHPAPFLTGLALLAGAAGATAFAAVALVALTLGWLVNR